jgi:hypothetical protein
MSDYISTFDGVDDYISIVQPKPMKSDLGMSMAVWVKPTAFTSGTIGKGIFEQSSTANLNSLTLQATTTSQANVQWQGYAPSGVSGASIISTGSVLTGAWTHIACVYGSGTSYLYVNGSLQGSGALILNNNDTSNIKLGSILNGQLNDFRIYGKSLNAQDISNLYNATTTTSVTVGSTFSYFISGDSLHWKLDGTGSDSSSSGYHASGDGSFSWSTGRVSPGSCLVISGATSGVVTSRIYANIGSFDMSATGCSFGAWMRVPSNVGHVLISQGTTVGTNQRLYIGITGSNTWAPGIGAISMSSLPATGAYLAESGVWVHNFLCISGTNYKFYTNGSLIYNNTFASFVTLSPFGVYTYLNQQRQSEIDDVRFYYRQLSAEEVAYIYNNGAGLVDDTYTEDSTVTTSTIVPSEDLNEGKVLFNGILEDIDYTAKEQVSSVSLRGRDYTAKLQDITIPPEVYTDEEVSYIVIDLMKKYCEDVTYNNVDYTSVILPRIAFNHDSLFQAFKKLADLSGYNFYVDENKDLHFELQQNNDSGLSFGHNNTIKTSWKNTRKELYNSVWVYGDRTLTAWKQLFAVTGGSVYTLDYKPSNTNVEVNGVQKKGGVAEMSSTPESGTNFLVSYHDKQVIFTSGTSIGNSIPSTGSILVLYQRQVPIVKFGQDRASLEAYGLKEKVVMDKAIKDANEAEDLMKSILDTESNPKVMGDIEIYGYQDINMGDYCICNYPKEGIGSKAYDIISVNYSLNKTDLLSENFIGLKVNRKIKNITDEIVNIKEDVDKLKAGDVSSSELLSRFEFGAGSIGIRANWRIYQKNIGTAFIMGNLSNGIMGATPLGSGNLGTFTIIGSGGDY